MRAFMILILLSGVAWGEPAKKPKKPRKAKAKKVEVVQPEKAAEKAPEPPPEDEVEEGGVVGGVAGGVLGGTVGAPPPPPPAPKPRAQHVPAKMLQERRVDAKAPLKLTAEEVATLPGEETMAVVKVCVDTAGAVAMVQVFKPISPEVDAALVAHHRGWRFEPLVVDGKATPMCGAVVYRFVR